MSSSTLRRRLYHGDVDGRRNEQMDTFGSDGLDEPLLGSYGDRSKAYDSREEEDWDIRKKEEQHWTFLFSTLIAQWAQWLGISL
ncbi:ELMO/CED-12 family protein [Rhynchospora pubera]|uniref:ELMO/CED-12 family protein n=1 Tax=Rhynchospora pubera TaxID=906938 RepID=A0AAV8F3K8_9POAL|nr:ELMO/CED-12 family protein [Rhynchospora pubera]